MKPLDDILESIRNANDRYRTLKLSQTADQSEILRDLSCAYVDLVDHRIEARDRWIDAYNNAEGTNANRERTADTEVREYDLIRDILKAVDNQMNSVRSTLSASKQN